MTTLANGDVPLTPEGVRFCPGAQGGAEWNGPAYNPQNNTIVVGEVDWCTTVRTDFEGGCAERPARSSLDRLIA
jgi:alcohol dehydrogenase (cytochrome c)